MTKKNRALRIDKKIEVKPTISGDLKDFIYRLSHILSIPVKDVIEDVLIYGTQSKKTLDELSIYFKRAVRVNNTIYMSNDNPAPLNKRSSRRNERVSTRIKQPLHENLSAFAYASDCSVSKFCALIIEVVSYDLPYIESKVEGIELRGSRKTEYERLLRRSL